MAEALAIEGAKWVASTILTSLLKEGVSYLGIGISTQLQNLEETILPQFQLVIEAAERSSVHKAKLELWLRKLKDAVYEAEDVMDLYKYQILKEKVSDLNTRPALKPFKRVARKVNAKLSIFSPQKIKLRRSLNNLEAIATEAKTFRELLGMPIGDGTVPHGGRNRGLQNVTTSLPPPKVFGRDKERDEIIDKYLLDTSAASEIGKSYSVVAIVGMGGAGKTTLAQIIYNDQRVVDYFDIKMWVCVSRKLDVFRHTREMIESTTKNECPRLENFNVLQDKLKDMIKSKKVLLVLDDIWCDKLVNETEWENLLAPLAIAAMSGSKILVTTRTENLPAALRSQYSMALKDLEENDIVSLFMLHAFGGAKLNDSHLQQKLENIGIQIVQKLHRSPLAVKAVGSQLSKRLETDVWRAALEQDNLSDTTQALLWSYQRLSAPLQCCFSYFSLFPKGHSFKAEEMIHFWMAEGFIDSSKDSRRMEDIGKDYIYELVSGSFLQTEDDCIFRCYNMHDLFHDLAERVSEEDCLRIEDDYVKEIPPTIRRLSIYGEGLTQNSMRFNKFKNLRTLIVDGSVSSSASDHLFAAIEKHKNLRVLRLELNGRTAKRLPESIGDLKLLRYLNIILDDLLELPQSLGKLYHLQLLYSPYCSSLPRSLSNLINLRHFEGNERALIALPNIGRLTSLQIDVYYDVNKKKGYDIGQLQNLNELRGSLIIDNLQNVEGKDKAAEANLKDKKHLQHLILTWENDDGKDCRRRDLDREVLEGLQPHPNLTRLSISGYQSPRNPNWFLQQGCLQNLMYLMLYKCTALEFLPPMSHLFPRCLELEIYHLYNLKKLPLLPQGLEKLLISRCPSLVSEEEELQLPETLSNLYLLDCPGISSLPVHLPKSLHSLQITKCHGILSLPDLPKSLEDITIADCPILMERCRSPSGEDWPKIAHMPQNDILQPWTVSPDDIFKSLH